MVNLEAYEMYSDRDLGQRERLEDYVVSQFVTTKSGIELVINIVCDGVGGAERGELAARLAADTVIEFLKSSEDTHIPSLIRKSIVSANDVVFSRRKTNANDNMTMATTIAVAIIDTRQGTHGQLFVGHVGDSQIYLVRDDNLFRLNIDHTLANESIIRGEATPEQAMMKPNAHALTRAVGLDVVEPDTGIYIDTLDVGLASARGEQGIRLLERDTIICCSDGLTEYVNSIEENGVTDSELIKYAKDDNVSKAARALISIANSRGVNDNLAVSMTFVRLQKQSGQGFFSGVRNFLSPNRQTSQIKPEDLFDEPIIPSRPSREENRIKTPSPSNESGIARILLERDYTPIGMGILVSENQIVTPAHVVSSALGISLDQETIPEGEIVLDFVASGDRIRIKGNVVSWNPDNDIAILQLSADPPEETLPVILGEAVEYQNANFSVLGFPRNYPDGVIVNGKVQGQVANNRIQLQADPGGRSFDQGFSGGCVINPGTNQVLGMLVAVDASDNNNTAMMISPETILATIHALGENQEKSSQPNQRKSQINVMLSSSSTDLEEHRRNLLEVVTSLQMIPQMLDLEINLSHDLLTSSLELVDESEIYILVLGFRYGYVPEDPVRNPNSLSLTHLEYRRAQELAANGEKCVFSFLLDESLTPEAIRPEMVAFRREVLQNQVKFFTNIDDLKLKVAQTLSIANCITDLKESNYADIQTNNTPIEERNPTIFVAYADADADYAKRLIDDLNRMGHACWIDTSGIKGGDEWIQSIVEGINNSYAFIIVVTVASTNSKWVRDEILWAQQKNKVIIPVIIEDATQEDGFFPLTSYQGIDFLGQDYETAFNQLLTGLPDPILLDTQSTEDSSSRQAELIYMDRLQLAELMNSDKYVSLSQLGTSSTTTQPFRDIIEKIHDVRRCIILGEPGSGKTSTLWRIASDLIETAVSDLSAPIPILVRLGRWTDSEQQLIQFIASQVDDLGRYLSELVSDLRLALLIDGLDEVPISQRDHKFNQLQEFIEQNPEITIVITSRTQNYSIDLGLPRVELKPLENNQVREFAVRYLGSETGQQFFDELTSRVELLQFGRNPYMLLMLSQLYTQLGEIPADNTAIVEQFVKILLQRENISDDEMYQLDRWLSDLAIQMDTNSQTEIAYADAMRLGGERLIYLANSASILETSSLDTIRFRHRIFQDYYISRLDISSQTPRRTIRVFLEGPGDTDSEKKIASDLINSLYQRFDQDEPLNLELISSVYSSHESINPADCEVVIIILRSRFGTPLPPDQTGTKSNGEPYQSYVEWAYLNAQSSSIKSDNSQILIFKSSQEAEIQPGEDWQEKLNQKQKLEDFLASITTEIIEYSSLEVFREIFRRTLEDVLRYLLITDHDDSMSYVVYITEECESQARRYQQYDVVNSVKDKLERDQTISNWHRTQPHPVLIKHLGRSYRLIATQIDFSDDLIVICFLTVLPRSDSEYGNFVKEPQDFTQPLIPDAEGLRLYIEERFRESPPSLLPDLENWHYKHLYIGLSDVETNWVINQSRDVNIYFRSSPFNNSKQISVSEHSKELTIKIRSSNSNITGDTRFTVNTFRDYRAQISIYGSWIGRGAIYADVFENNELIDTLLLSEFYIEPKSTKDFEQQALPSTSSSADPYATQPDLVIRIYAEPITKSGSLLRFYCVANAQYSYLELDGRTVSYPKLPAYRDVPALLVDEIIGQFTRAISNYSGAGLKAELYQIGKTIWNEILPPRLRGLYQIITKTDNQKRTFAAVRSILLIIDNAPWLPYELATPQSMALCEEFEVTRWIDGLGQARRPTIPLSSVYASQDADLNETLPDYETISWGDEFSITEPTTNWRLGLQSDTPIYSFQNMLATGGLRGRATDIVLGHQDFDWVAYLHQQTERMQAKNPLVMNISVIDGGGDNALTDQSIYKQAVESGASVVVGTWWAVKPSEARVFSQVFYESLNQMKTVGESLFVARQAVSLIDDSANSLAFFAIGDTTATGYPILDAEGYVSIIYRESELESELSIEDQVFDFDIILRQKPPAQYVGKRHLLRPWTDNNFRILVKAMGCDVEYSEQPDDKNENYVRWRIRLHPRELGQTLLSITCKTHDGEPFAQLKNIVLDIRDLPTEIVEPITKVSMHKSFQLDLLDPTEYWINDEGKPYGSDAAQELDIRYLREKAVFMLSRAKTSQDLAQVSDGITENIIKLLDDPWLDELSHSTHLSLVDKELRFLWELATHNNGKYLGTHLALGHVPTRKTFKDKRMKIASVDLLVHDQYRDAVPNTSELLLVETYDAAELNLSFLDVNHNPWINLCDLHARRKSYFMYLSVEGDPDENALSLVIEDKQISLTKSMNRPRRLGRKPIILLSVAKQVSSEPIDTAPFIYNLLHLGASAVIAPICSLPTDFAVEFETYLLARLRDANGTSTIGTILMETRNHFIDKHDNPLALSYLLFGNPEIELEFVDG
ncbi:MAG: hypothetical protein Phog2KO_45260 [Phototrophicaceae bacterium]